MVPRWDLDCWIVVWTAWRGTAPCCTPSAQNHPQIRFCYKNEVQVWYSLLRWSLEVLSYHTTPLSMVLSCLTKFEFSLLNQSLLRRAHFFALFLLRFVTKTSKNIWINGMRNKLMKFCFLKKKQKEEPYPYRNIVFYLFWIREVKNLLKQLDWSFMIAVVIPRKWSPKLRLVLSENSFTIENALHFVCLKEESVLSCFVTFTWGHFSHLVEIVL